MVPRWRTAGSPILPARSAKAGMFSLHHRRGRDLDVRRHRADDERAALELDAGQALDLPQIDQVLRAGQAQLHGRDQRVAAGKQLRLFLLAQQVRRLPHGRGTMVSECIHGCCSYAALRLLLTFCSACHTACAVAGMANSSLPIASVMALMTAAGAAMAPASPQPLMPSGFDGAWGDRHVDLERRQVVGARHAVVHERAGDELAVLVVDGAFEQRLADALGDAAVHLALDDHRVDDRAEVVDRGPAPRSRCRRCRGSTSTSQM